MCHRAARHPKWGRHHGRAWKYHKFTNQQFPPVNIEELDDHYQIELFAAGYQKSDFKIDLADDTLIISVDRERDEDRGSMRWQRREYRLKNFQRRFVLNDKVDQEDIQAKYDNGVLRVILKKKEGTETFRRQIELED